MGVGRGVWRGDVEGEVCGGRRCVEVSLVWSDLTPHRKGLT